MNTPKATRKPRPLIVAAVIALVLLFSYFGAYFGNVTKDSFYYIETTNLLIEPDVRVVPRYRVAQFPSEIVFWPISSLQWKNSGQTPEWKEDWQ